HNTFLEMITQFLDNLLDEGVLKFEEKDKIIKANRTKARDLIDKVMNKGDEVRLILHLQMKDSTLYKHLCQTCDCVIILCCSCTGHSWIIRIFRYNRPGAEKDEKDMEKLLSTLGYEVKMENALDEFSKHPKLKETDSVFVVISSHGKLGAVLGVNHKPDEPDELKVDDIYDKLNAKNCPALVDKPKIFIIQACRGKETGSVLVEADDVAVREIEEDVLRYTHKEKDFIALLSSTPRQSSSQHINYELNPQTIYNNTFFCCCNRYCFVQTFITRLFPDPVYS
uniref:Caspase-8 n=1 Tax=Neogobius melanostomus TaxID=47308 RepID=A0A8C6UNE8_9GOBI